RGVAAPRDQRGATIDHGVVDLASGVVAGICRCDQLTSKPGPEFLDRALVHRTLLPRGDLVAALLDALLDDGSPRGSSGIGPRALPGAAGPGVGSRDGTARDVPSPCQPRYGGDLTR